MRDGSCSGSGSQTSQHNVTVITYITHVQPYTEGERRLKRLMLSASGSSSAMEAIMRLNKCACGCGRKFGLLRFRYYQMQFASGECLTGYLARLSTDTRHKISILEQARMSEPSDQAAPISGRVSRPSEEVVRPTLR